MNTAIFVAVAVAAVWETISAIYIKKSGQNRRELDKLAAGDSTSDSDIAHLVFA